MANTIAHLAVAQKVLEAKPELVSLKFNYYLGTIAPDAIDSKVGAMRDDKKKVHLRTGISDKEWLMPEKMLIFDLRLEKFIKESIIEEDDEHHRDFSVGYLVHLLTDKYNHATIRQRILREFDSDGDKSLIPTFVNELEAMDCYLIRGTPELSALFYTIMELPIINCMPGYIEAEYLEKSLKWWKYQYIPQIATREPKILQYREIDEFISGATDYILKELEKII
jgi:hypothetical protein